MEANWGGKKGERLRQARNTTLHPGAHGDAQLGEEGSQIVVDTLFSWEEKKVNGHSCKSGCSSWS